MYAGQVMEEQRVPRACSPTPQHPYTAALLAALPEHSDGAARLATIPGVVPGRLDRPRGCLFSAALRLCDRALRADAARVCAPWLGGRCAATIRSAIRERDARIAPTARRRGARR